MLKETSNELETFIEKFLNMISDDESITSKENIIENLKKIIENEEN